MLNNKKNNRPNFLVILADGIASELFQGFTDQASSLIGILTEVCQI